MSSRLNKRLEGISKCAIGGHRVKDLYKTLVNVPELWDAAYAAIGSNDGATTKGIDDTTADGQSEDRNREIMTQLKNNSYVPTPVRRVYIPRAMENSDLWVCPTLRTNWYKLLARFFLKRSMNQF